MLRQTACEDEKEDFYSSLQAVVNIFLLFFLSRFIKNLLGEGL